MEFVADAYSSSRTAPRWNLLTIRTEDTEQFAWLTLFIGVGRGRGERGNFMCDYVIFGLNRRCFVDN